MVDGEEWVERQGESEGLVQRESCGRGITVTLFVTPFSTIVASAMEGGPKGS